MRATKQLEERLSQITLRSDCLMVGRAAWGLHLLLLAIKKESSPCRIAMPSFLCQSPLAAVVMAGWEPIFLDVDIETGNVAHTEWLRAVALKVDAILYVHMFGGIAAPDAISKLCKENNIFFIEDAAQAFGGSHKSVPCGGFGDASIISFGHTKSINVGGGGAVLVQDSSLIKEINNLESRYNYERFDRIKYQISFRDKFYSVRNLLLTNFDDARVKFVNLINYYSKLIPVRWDDKLINKIHSGLNKLKSTVNERREKNLLLVLALADSPLVNVKMTENSVPWRSVFRYPNINWIQQSSISNTIRSENIEVSNWYIPSHWMVEKFSRSHVNLPSTEKMSKEVFQFWIDDSVSLEDVKRFSPIIKEKTTGLKIKSNL